MKATYLKTVGAAGVEPIRDFYRIVRNRCRAAIRRHAPALYAAALVLALAGIASGIDALNHLAALLLLTTLSTEI